MELAIAENMVSEMAAFTDYRLVHSISEHLQLSHDQIKQLPFDEAMQTVSFLHHSNRVMGNYEALVKTKAL